MHGIMSSIAEFYSRNLANEVTKGLVQKASLGGTVTRAPLGYKNVHLTDDLGRINRTVEIDAERAHLITWAFYRYAEGDCRLRVLLDELTDRGLTTRPTPKRPSKELASEPAQAAAQPLLQRRDPLPRRQLPRCARATRRPANLAAGPRPPHRTRHRRRPGNAPTATTCAAASTAADCGSRLMFTIATQQVGYRIPLPGLLRTGTQDHRL